MKEKQKKANCELGELILQLKKEKELTLEKIAERSGLGVSQISDIIHGKREPTLQTLQKISKSFEMSFPIFLSQWTGYILADMQIPKPKLEEIEKNLKDGFVAKQKQNETRKKNLEEQLAKIAQKIEEM